MPANSSATFRLPAEQTAAFEAVWRHQTGRLFGHDKQLESAVKDRIEEIRAFASRNRGEIDRQLDRYAGRLLGWSRAHQAARQVITARD